MGVEGSGVGGGGLEDGARAKGQRLAVLLFNSMSLYAASVGVNRLNVN